ncbi:MAG: MBL fold metallo-hydrolase [Bacteroidales bacterium]|nr:MBL fold metallo-hydrolase [Bacteroidales bacterium]
MIKGVLLTHAHLDHIYGLPELFERFPDCLLYTNDFGMKTLADDKLNMSRYMKPQSTIPDLYVFYM